MKRKYKNLLHVFFGITFMFTLFSFYMYQQVSELEIKAIQLSEQKRQSERLLEQKQEAMNSNVATKKVYLTFDDGPSRYTDELLDILKDNDVKATFFVIGREDERSKRQYKRILEEGHTLAMHTYTHNYQTIYSSLDAFSKDVEKLSNLLEDVTGKKPTIYRFPGGSSNSVCKVSMKTLIHYLNKNNITYYDWNALNGDALTKDISTAKLNNNILKDVKNHDTSIVLMHDLGDRRNTVDSLDSLIKELKALNCQLLPIDEGTKPVQHVKNDGMALE